MKAEVRQTVPAIRDQKNFGSFGKGTGQVREERQIQNQVVAFIQRLLSSDTPKSTARSPTNPGGRDPWRQAI